MEMDRDRTHGSFGSCARESHAGTLVNDDTPAADRLIGAVVIDRESRALVPNLDAKRIFGWATRDGTVFGRGQKSVLAQAVDRPRALELGQWATDGEPLVHGTVKVELARAEFKLCQAAGHGRALLVLGDETEIGFPLG